MSVDRYVEEVLILILTTASYILFIMSLSIVSLYSTSIILKALRIGKDNLRIEHDVDRSLAIVVPSKNEPQSLVIERLNKLSTAKCYEEVLVVLDDDIGYVSNIVKTLREEFFSRGIIIARLNGFGGRNGALTTGAKMSLSDNVLVIDVDTTPSEEMLCYAKKCRNVCIGIWDPYVDTGTRVEEAMAYITRFGSWVFYELKSRLELFVYPLGSGTTIDKQLLKNIGFWRTDVIQDDIWLGVELMYRGIKPRLLGSRIEVGVPKTLNAVRLQQCRWSYGASNILSRFLSKALRAPMKVKEKIDAIAYIAQPIVSILSLFSYIFAIAASAIERELYVNVLHLLPIALALVFQGFAMDFYGGTVLKLSKWKRICLTGRASAIYTLLSPLLGYYALKGLLRLRYVYRITPKSVDRGRFVDLSEVIALALASPTLVLSIVNKNFVTLLISLPLILASLYSLVRLEKG